MKKSIFTFICLLSFLSACKNEPAQNPKAPKEKTEEVSKDKNSTLYAWVDKLNLRDAPNTKGKVIATVANTAPLEFSGEQSDFSDEIVLRGLLYNGPWLKVTTPDKKTGWVYGGAVAKKGEKKGTPPINELQFDFPHFGKYDLNTWKRFIHLDESGGDAEIKTTSYKKDGKILEVSNSNTGEYGYSYRHKLLDSEHNVLKEREFSFQIDPFLITELVVDYTAKPMKQYKRSQRVGKHFMQPNSRPLLVNAPWE